MTLQYRARIILLVIGVFGFGLSVKGFQISGTVRDSQGVGIAFASVYISGTSVGTQTNSQGEYVLNIPLGRYNITFSSLGYVSKTIQVEISSGFNPSFNIVLQNYARGLKEVVIKSDEKDPAEEIMHRVISKKKDREKRVMGFRCTVYSKGIQKLENAPNKFLGIDIKKPLERMGLDSGKKGILYLSEAVSKINYKKPNSYSEEIISSKISGNPKGFTFNQVSRNILDFNQNTIILGSNTNNQIISPLSDHAFSFYRFILLDKNPSENGFIDKIQVLPKNKYGKSFRGIIYISEPDYRISGLDLLLTKETGMEFLDTLSIQQNFIHLKGDTSLLASEKFLFHGKIFSFSFRGSFILSFSDYTLNPHWTSKDFTARELKLEAQAGKRDTGYWKNIRPMPLTVEEKRDYLKKDNLFQIHQTKKYLDSIDRVDNANHFYSGILSGFHFRNSYRKENWDLKPLFESFNYNTVEGYNLNPSLSFRKRTSDTTSFQLSADFRYGFSNHHFNLYFFAGRVLNNKRNREIAIKLGSTVADFNSLGAIDPFLNSLQTLYNKLNILKLYEKRFVSVRFHTRIIPGLELESGLSYSSRLPLVNTSFSPIRDLTNQAFSANNPFGGLNNLPAFSENKVLVGDLELEIHLGEKYQDRPEGIFIAKSPYPKINLIYKKAIPGVLGSEVHFNFLSIRVHDERMSLGNLGAFSYSLEYGNFLGPKSLYYMDGHSFASRTNSFSHNLNTPFLLLNSYLYNSFSQYGALGFENNFEGLMLNKIPFLRKLKLKEVIGGSFLKSDQFPGYFEVYGGVSKLGFGLNYVTSFSGGKLSRHLVTLSFGF